MVRSNGEDTTDDLLISFAYCPECEMEHPVDISEFVATKNTERVQEEEFGEIKTPVGTKIIVVACLIKDLVLNHGRDFMDHPDGESIEIKWLTLEEARVQGWNLEGPFIKGEG